MALFRTYQPNTRMDHYELDGLITRLDREIAEHGEEGDEMTPYYVGARVAIYIARHHEFVDTQDDFMRLFDLKVAETWEDKDGR